MTRARFIIAALVFGLAGCAQDVTKDAAYFHANPAEIETTLGACPTGKIPAEVCQAAMQAKADIAGAKRLDAYKQTMDGYRPPVAAAN